MNRWPLWIAISVIALACSSSGFQGGAAKAPIDGVENAGGPASGSDGAVDDAGDGHKGGGSSDENDDDGDEEELDSVDEGSLKEDDEGDLDLDPDFVVDGQEVYNSCSKCIKRGVQLGKENGFTTGIEKTINMGFYKIQPSRNLCDVHFMSDLNLPIDDHDGEDTVGNGQIILYCPCDCGWARSGPPLEFPPFIP